MLLGEHVQSIACMDAWNTERTYRYGDGSIRLWDARTATTVISFNGHHSAVTTLAFNTSGVRLASGGQDTDVIIWDLIEEVGLYKLRGHQNQVTGLHFLDVHADEREDEETHATDETQGRNKDLGMHVDHVGFLLTTSKDALIKLWDLSTRHCMETHVAQTNGECWSMAVSQDHDSCIIGGNDGELKVWSVDVQGLRETSTQLNQDIARQYLKDRGTLLRQSKDKTTGLAYGPRDKYIAAHGSDRSIDLWRIRTNNEVQKTLARKRKRRREKSTAIGANNMQMNDNVDEIEWKSEDVSSAEVSDVVIPYVIIRTSGRVRSIDWINTKMGQTLQLLVSASNNELEVYDIHTKSKEKKMKSNEPAGYDRTFSVDLPGHRTDIRSIALSSDDRMLATASNGSLKLWNLNTQSCIRTLECGYALCSSFLPGDKIVVVGNRNGDLEVFDIASSTLIETLKAHEGPIWTLHVHPDGKSIVTGSADKTAKFWTFQIVQENIAGTKRTTPRLKLVHNRTLKVSDDILSVRYSPDSRFLAVSLLDNTVKVFFTDTLKLFLSLYGHKLPVLSMDISYDSKLIVTCSADKNVRLWGMDFGDCHKALFAHQDSIMQVSFVPHNQDGNGHHFFSAGKDRMLKYWDGDKFEQIQKLEGHHGEIWAIAVSRTGDFVVSASHDKSIRVWKQTDEQIFLEEEREKELEELYENKLTMSIEQDAENVEEQGEAIAATKQTTETLVAGEKIAEALEIGMTDLDLIMDWNETKALSQNAARPQRNPVFLAYGNQSAEAHVLSVVQKIKAAALQDALLILQFEKVPALFTFLRKWADRQWDMPLTCRILFFMLKTHHRQIIASKTMRPMMDGIRESLRRALQQQKDVMGFNIAALRFVGNQVKDRGTWNYVDESQWGDEETKGKEKKKRFFVDVA